MYNMLLLIIDFVLPVTGKTTLIIVPQYLNRLLIAHTWSVCMVVAWTTSLSAPEGSSLKENHSRAHRILH